MMSLEPLSTVTGLIIRSAIRLHADLGPGLVESVYEGCLQRLLELEGLRVQRQVAIDFEYGGHRFRKAFRLDMLVEDSVIIEVKAFESAIPRQRRQLLTYLRLANRPVGLLLNFGEATLVDGLARVVNDRYRQPSTPQ
jgi:GxxExxY protein